MEPSPQIGLFTALYTTRALRRLKPDPVPEAVLFQLLDAAIRAPSGRNAQDWRFVLVTDAAVKRQLQAWAAEGWARYQPRYAAEPALLEQLPRTPRLALKAVAWLVQHLAEVPVIIVVCGERGRHHTPGGSIFPAVQNLLLAARGLGLGASIFNLPLVRPEELAALLAIPASYEIYCLVPLGYPRDRHGPVRRKPVKHVAFWERWGQPWAFALAQPEEGWQARWLPATPQDSEG
ncbi:MAG: nitroreductase [Candidatus Tectimicrobiota bacterium]|nr:MAG: nitroreductase [Candidatus Tectomicrobia bacterium]